MDGFDDITGGEYSDIIYFDFSDDNKHDTVSGGLGDDVFVFHGNSSSNESESLVLEDTSKQDMTERLEHLLTQDSISTDDVTLAGTITDFNLIGEDNSDSIVLSGFRIRQSIPCTMRKTGPYYWSRTILRTSCTLRLF